MQVTVRLFAMLRERAGAPEVTLELPDGARVGDALALIPPVSGGETSAAPWVRVSPAPLSLEELASRVRDSRAGAVVTFCGVTREVERLEYDAYVQMAEERMTAIATEAVERHRLCAAAGGDP